MRSLLLGVAAALVAVSAPALPSAAQATAEPGPPYTLPAETTPNTTVDTDVGIVMSDGARLSALVARPTTAARRPTILTATGYNKSVLGGSVDPYVTRGYNVVIVDDRGTGSSEGMWDAWGPRIQQDYRELLDWIVTQPWSNGRIGTTGMSYMGITALFLAQTGHPAVQAVWADVPMGDAYRDVTVHGGNLNIAFMPFWLTLVAALGLLPPASLQHDPVLAAGILAQHVLGTAQFHGTAVGGVAVGGEQAYDGPFYQQRSPERRAGQLRVPVAYTGGWFDIFQRGETRLHRALTGLDTTRKKWFQTPTYHVGGESHWNEMGIGSPAAVQFAWFERWLKDADNGIEHLPTINLFTMGVDRWQQFDAWPPTGTTWEPLHLDPTTSGSAASLNDGSLTRNAPRQAGATLLPHLPLAGLCSRNFVQWSAGLLALMDDCEHDNRIAERTALTFTTEAFTADREVTGPLALTLWATGYRPEISFAVSVTDVAPDGTSRSITGGFLNGSHRSLDESRTRRDPAGEAVEPFHHYTRERQEDVPIGEPVEYAIEVFGTSHVFRAGHRLRVTLAGADAHMLAPALPEATKLLGVTQVLHGPDHPSRLLVPTPHVASPTEVAAGRDTAEDDRGLTTPAATLPATGATPPTALALLVLAGAAVLARAAGLRRWLRRPPAAGGGRPSCA